MKTPSEIIAEAMTHKPVAFRVGFSGGRDSQAVVHWCMENIEGCEPFTIRTGIGIKRTHDHVEEICARMNWPLHIFRAKEDCGQDYREIVKQHGFPGPDGHSVMYARLKERAIREVVRRAQGKPGQRVVLATGIRHDESVRRMRYAGKEVVRVGSQIWTSPIYWWSKDDRDAYNRKTGLPINPVSETLGMSGECLCGAFAHKGEKALIRIVCPETANYIDQLEQEVFEAGFNWGWEGKPPRGGHSKRQIDMFRPLCVGCEKEAA